MFVLSVQKCTKAKKLTSKMLNALISKIEVCHREKVKGKWVQRFTIHYNCIDAIEIPNLSSLPETKVMMKTKKNRFHRNDYSIPLETIVVRVVL